MKASIRSSFSVWLVLAHVSYCVVCPAQEANPEVEPVTTASQNTLEEAEYEEASSRSERAMQLGHSALAAYQQQNYNKALSLFVEAEELVHSPVFLLYSARSAQALGKPRLAQEYYLRCSSEVLESSSPQAWRDAHLAAQVEEKQLRAQTPEAIFEFRGEVTFPVQVSIVASNQELADAEVLQTEESKLSWMAPPGQYNIVARDATGNEIVQNWLAEVGSREVHIEFRFSVATADAQAPLTSSINSESSGQGGLSTEEKIELTEANRQEVRPYHAYRTASFAAMITGASFFVAGAGAGVASLVMAGQVKAGCDGANCRPEDEQKSYQALRWANMATVGIVVGALGVGTGVGLLLYDKKLSAKSNKAQLSVSLGFNDLRLSGSF